MKEAASWIASQFRRFGLRPVPSPADHFQKYDFTDRDGRTISERNVIGYMEGRDPERKDEYILVSAHFDHVGVRKPIEGDAIYNGADDDASGVAAMIGIARNLHEMQAAPSRSILFIAFSAEELGHKGSRHYRDHPLLPLDRMYVNINFEMVGQCSKLGNRTYYITGPSRSNLDEYLVQYNTSKPWRLDASAQYAENLFLRADNASFAVMTKQDGITYGVPAHTFSFYDGEKHLHRPHDEPAILDYDNLASFIDYMTGLVLHLADLEDDIVWTDENYRHITQRPAEFTAP